MPFWLKILVVLIIVFSTSSLLWFLFGSTAYFQRGMDIVGTTYLLLVGIPIILLILLFTILLIKGAVPSSGIHYIGLCVVLVVSIILSVVLIYGVNSSGWAKEKIESDSLKITADGKYQYHIDFINLFQRNSYARLYLKDISTGEEKFIPVNIQTRQIKTLVVGKVNHWIILESTDVPSLYILSTTDKLRISAEKFQINISEGASSRLN